MTMPMEILDILRFDVSELQSIANHEISIFGIYFCKIFFDYFSVH